TQTQPVTLNVNDFAMSALSRGAFALSPDETSGPDTFSLTSVNGFSGAVTLACSGLPTGANCLFAPSDQIALTAGSLNVGVSYSVNTSAAPPGNYNVTITATSPNTLPNSQIFTL